MGGTVSGKFWDECFRLFLIEIKKYFSILLDDMLASLVATYLPGLREC